MRESYFREVSPVALQRIEERRCPNCGTPKAEWKRRLSWTCCSVECTENYYKEFDKSYSWETFRYEIFKRDNGVCARCGVQCLKNSLTSHDMKPDESLLIADHIIPIVLGGEMWDKSNIQTLCIACNKIKTKEDMNNIAKHRKRQKKDMGIKMCSPFVAQEML